MPAWMEILINVIGYAGFVAVATYHRSPSEKFPEKFPDRWVPNRRGANLPCAVHPRCGRACRPVWSAAIRRRSRSWNGRLLLFSWNEQGVRFLALPFS